MNKQDKATIELFELNDVGEDAEVITDLPPYTPPENVQTCDRCDGYGYVAVFSFGMMQYEADDCPVCGGDGWVEASQ